MLAGAKNNSPACSIRSSPARRAETSVHPVRARPAGSSTGTWALKVEDMVINGSLLTVVTEQVDLDALCFPSVCCFSPQLARVGWRLGGRLTFVRWFPDALGACPHLSLTVCGSSLRLRTRGSLTHFSCLFDWGFPVSSLIVFPLCACREPLGLARQQWEKIKRSHFLTDSPV